MAEYCLDCWNKLNGTHDKPRKYIMSEELDLCEGCGEWRNVIVIDRRGYWLNRLRPALNTVFFPLLLVGAIPFALWRGIDALYRFMRKKR